MKILSFMIIALVATLILNLPTQSYADSQLDTLLRIAIQARDNLSINISQITNIPSDISQTFKQGSDETDALATAVEQQDVSSAKQHFLTAMQFFKDTNDKINTLNATSLNDQQRSKILELQSEISRLKMIGQRLKDIATSNDVEVDFTQFDQSIQNAKQNLDAGNIDAVSVEIQKVNQFISVTHHYLATIAQERTSDRAKDFTEKQIERLNITSLNETSSNVTTQATTSVKITSNETQSTPQTPQEMVTQLRKLISEGKVNEAITVLKSLQAYQQGQLKQSTKELSQQNPANNSSNQNTTEKLIPSNSVKINSTVSNQINSAISDENINSTMPNSVEIHHNEIAVEKTNKTTTNSAISDQPVNSSDNNSDKSQKPITPSSLDSNNDEKLKKNSNVEQNSDKKQSEKNQDHPQSKKNRK